MYRGGFESKMSNEEAKLILGFEEDEQVSLAKLRKQHKKLMMTNHPDKGGSKYVAMKINGAKDLLEKNQN